MRIIDLSRSSSGNQWSIDVVGCKVSRYIVAEKILKEAKRALLGPPQLLQER